MQVYTKKIILLFLTMFLGASVVACQKNTDTETPNESIIPQLSNPDAVFVSTDDYTITYQDLYNEVKINDGLNQLLIMVDTDLLSDYVTSVTQAQIDDKMDRLIFGTSDPEEIAAFTTEEQADMTQSFYDSMYLLGFEGKEEEYVRLLVARENYATAQMTSSDNSEETWYVGPRTIAEEYDSTYYNDVQSIKIRFYSQTDAKNILRDFKLVSLNGELKLYTGETPLAQVPRTSLNDTNTRSLTDAELLSKFLDIYNYVYGDYRDEVANDTSFNNLLALDEFNWSHEELATINASLDDFIYSTLGTYEDYTSDTDDTIYYTYEPVAYSSSNDTSYYLILNLSRTDIADVTDFDGTEAELVALIGQDNYDTIRQDLIDATLGTSSFISNQLVAMRQEHNFNIYDYYIGVDYQGVDGEFVTDENGDQTNVATYDNVIITADDLLTYALNANAPLYAIYAAQSLAVEAAHYEDVYCADETEACVYDVMENNSAEMKAHFDAYDSMQASFESSYYASYYTLEEYLYLAYGVKSKEEMIQYYVQSNLQTYLIYDTIEANSDTIADKLMELAQPYYDNYFSLYVQHILIYLDRDEDGSPDDYEEFYASMTDTTAFDQLIVDFEAAIRNYLSDQDNTMAMLVSEYNKASRTDATWGVFKQNGLYLMTETLGEMSYKDDVGTYEEPFFNELISMYQAYQNPINIHKDYIFSDTLVETSYGLHLIQAAQGTDFDPPSAKFSMTYSTGIIPDYPMDIVNTTDEVTKAQLLYYATYRFTEIATVGDLTAIYGLAEDMGIPFGLSRAIDAFYADTYDALYVVGYLNYIMIDQLQAGTYTFANPAYCNMTSAQLDERLTQIQSIYWQQIFADYDYTE